MRETALVAPAATRWPWATWGLPRARAHLCLAGHLCLHTTLSAQMPGNFSWHTSRCHTELPLSSGKALTRSPTRLSVSRGARSSLVARSHLCTKSLNSRALPPNSRSGEFFRTCPANCLSVRARPPPEIVSARILNTRNTQRFSPLLPRHGHAGPKTRLHVPLAKLRLSIRTGAQRTGGELDHVKVQVFLALWRAPTAKRLPHEGLSGRFGSFDSAALPCARLSICLLGDALAFRWHLARSFRRQGRVSRGGGARRQKEGAAHKLQKRNYHLVG